MKKRILSILTALVLCLTLLPTAALAEGETLQGSGTESDPWLLSGTSVFVEEANSNNHAVPYKISALVEGEYDYYLPAGHYKLTASISDISITILGNVTLDLNGFKLTGKSNSPAIKVGYDDDSPGHLTLTDSSTNGTGKVTNNNGLAINVGNGSLTLESGTVECTSYAIAASSATTVTLKGGTVSAPNGAKAIYLSHLDSGKTSTKLCADGGTVNGTVENNEGTITRSSDSVTTATTFNGTVQNGGEIKWGTFNGDVANGYKSYGQYYSGTISGGTFNGTVTNLAYNNRYGTLDNSKRTIINNGVFIFQKDYSLPNNAADFGLTGIGYMQADFDSDGQLTANDYYSNSGTRITDPNTKKVVTFDLNGDTGTIPPQGIYDEGKAAKPTDPTRDGYTFGGWYEKENGAFKATAFDFDTTITADTTLYAKWTHVAHTGGEANCQAKAVCETCGEPYGELDPANHVGTLGEWQRDENGHWKYYSCCPTVKVNEGTHSYTDGLCECGAVQYTVTFDPNGGTVDPTSATTDIDGKLTELPTPTRSGSYRFDGWFTEQNGGTAITVDTVFTAHTTVYAHWTFIPVYIPAPTYAVAVSDTDNGTVTVSPRYAERGDTVTVTVTPDKGCTLETLTVLDQNGRELELTNNGNGTYSFKMPGGKVTVTATFMEDNSMLNFFVDVTADKYYYDAVLWAAKNGITGGVDENHFGPDQSCTRAQLVTFLWRAAGCPVVNYAMDFSDVDENDYYGEAVRWAASLGIVGGYGDGLFGTNDTITREQMVTILFRYAAQVQGLTAVTLQELVSGFGDADQVAPYALSAMNWAIGAGIVQGDSGMLLPGGSCTRAQIVTMLYRLLVK